ncbi:hypothetical protein ACVI1L_000470 [Bradyrhizobium sp. USDA 4516]
MKKKVSPDAPWVPDLPQGYTPLPERPVIDIMRHESGHLVIGRVLGFNYTGMKYQKTLAGAESDQKPTFSDLGQVSAYLKLRMMVLYAGVMAESLKEGKVQNEVAIKLANEHDNLTRLSLNVSN